MDNPIASVPPEQANPFTLRDLEIYEGFCAWFAELRKQLPTVPYEGTA